MLKKKSILSSHCAAPPEKPPGREDPPGGRSTSAKEHTSTLTQVAARPLADWGGGPANPHSCFKSSVGKEERGAKEETEIENTRSHLTESTDSLAQSGVGKGGDALLVLVAVAPVTVKPVGGAMELWLGCRSLGMPL